MAALFIAILVILIVLIVFYFVFVVPRLEADRYERPWWHYVGRPSRLPDYYPDYDYWSSRHRPYYPHGGRRRYRRPHGGGGYPHGNGGHPRSGELLRGGSRRGGAPRRGGHGRP